MVRYYTLDGRKPVPAEDLGSWSDWYFGARREVARTKLQDGTLIATEFVGVDGREPGERSGSPALFETRTFDPNWRSDRGERYASWSEARAGHRREVRRRIRRLES